MSPFHPDLQSYLHTPDNGLQVLCLQLLHVSLQLFPYLPREHANYPKNNTENKLITGKHLRHGLLDNSTTKVYSVVASEYDIYFLLISFDRYHYWWTSSHRMYQSSSSRVVRMLTLTWFIRYIYH